MPTQKTEVEIEEEDSFWCTWKGTEAKQLYNVWHEDILIMIFHSHLLFRCVEIEMGLEQPRTIYFWRIRCFLRHELFNKR